MPLRVFIYGSCVTRDAVDFWEESELRLGGYVARQSLLSAMAAPGDPEIFRLSQIDSSFQRRMFRGDVESSLIPTLRENKGKFDLILWDLTDERNGVQRLPGGGLVTRMPNLSRPSISRVQLGDVIGVDADEHFGLWNQALDAFLGRLADEGLLDRLVLNDSRWATVDDAGHAFDQGETFLNPTLERMSRVVRAAAVSVITPDASTCVGKVEHKWGRAPFHYVDDAYRSMTAGLMGLVNEGKVRTA